NQVQNAAQSAGDATSNLANGQVPSGLNAGAGTDNGAGGGDSALADAIPTVKVPELKNPLGNMHERMSDACTKAKTPDDNLVCEVRVRAYQLSWHFQDDAANVEGWQLVAPLILGANGAPEISLGAEEKVKVGHAFVATGPNGERLGYFKVTHVGPGGKDGKSQPSELSLRMGSATEGMQLHEYRFLGLGIAVHGSVETLLSNANHYVIFGMQTPNGPPPPFALYKAPSLVFGGGGTLSLDLSGLFSWSETRLRASGEYLSGNGTGLSATLIPIDLQLEKGFYLGKGLNFFLGLGPSITLAKLTAAFPSIGGFPGGTTNASATRFGGALDTGFDILFSPRVALRIAGVFRYNVGSSYSGDAAAALTENGAADSFSTLGGNVGLNLEL
ncbi:MAG TPA: hypothetical protein VGM44_09820, partial [Polyangiaceae bacterium]